MTIGIPSCLRVASFAAAALFVAPAADASAHGRRPDACKASAVQLLKACRLDAEEEARIDRVDCLNLTDRHARATCYVAVLEAWKDARAECKDQRDARLEVCELAGPAPYDPPIDPARFVEGIDNPFAPFAVGARRVYEKETDEGLERVVVEVPGETREILGVVCTVVRDRVFLDGVLIEDTVDWLAQDVDGNVWYFGEISQSFEAGQLVDLDGSFEAGKDGAKPGLWMKASPAVGDFYRQEWKPGEAEDVVQVLDLDADVDAPYADTGPLLQTLDFTPLEPGQTEYKFYAPGIGLVLETDPEDPSDRLALVEVTIP